MSDLKCRKNVKIMGFRIFRMFDVKCRKMFKIMDFRIFRMSDLKCRKNVQMVEKALKSCPGVICLIHFDHF